MAFKIMQAYAALSVYNGKESLRILENLPLDAQVMSIMARAHFELHEYTASAELFVKIRKLEPYRVLGMDIYATCLWHLKKKAELSFLGKEMEEIDKNAPQTW